MDTKATLEDYEWPSAEQVLGGSYPFPRPGPRETWKKRGMCARPACNEKEWRIDGYCSIYCRDVDEARMEALVAEHALAAELARREAPEVRQAFLDLRVMQVGLLAGGGMKDKWVQAIGGEVERLLDIIQPALASQEKPT